MRVTAMFLAAGVLGLLATVAVADSTPPDGYAGFWTVDSGPGNSWTASVWYFGAPNNMPTDYNLQIVPLPMANPPAIPYYWGDNNAPTGWTDYYLGQSQHFETNPPNAATVTQYGSQTGPLATTETQFGPYQMEIHTPVHVSLGNPGDSITLPLALGYWTGWAQGSPSFVLQLQAYDINGRQLSNASILFDGANAHWDGESGTSSDAYAKAAGAYSALGVSAWEADKPLPEPLTMLGVIAGVGGVAGYIRKRRAQA